MVCIIDMRPHNNEQINMFVRDCIINFARGLGLDILVFNRPYLHIIFTLHLRITCGNEYKQM